MPSDISIVNTGLLQLGLNPIGAFTESTREALVSRTIYEDVLRATLRDCAPGFAERQLALSLLDETRPGWAYVYGWPSDCVEARELYNPLTTGAAYDDDGNVLNPDVTIEFKVSMNEDGTKKVILANQEEAELIYTAYVTDANLFDPLFVSALSLNLAAHMAIPLKRDKVLRKDMMQEYMTAKSAANAKDANEGKKKKSDQSSFSRSRE
jgi:hypothetical protein